MSTVERFDFIIVQSNVSPTRIFHFLGTVIPCTAHKNRFLIKDFFSKCPHPQFPAVTFTEEILDHIQDEPFRGCSRIEKVLKGPLAKICY